MSATRIRGITPAMKLVTIIAVMTAHFVFYTSHLGWLDGAKLASPSFLAETRDGRLMPLPSVYFGIMSYSIAQTAMYDAESRQKQMTKALQGDRLEELPDILGNGLLQSMKSDLVRAEGRSAEVAQKYDRNHPAHLSAAAEVQTLRNKLAAELATVKGSINQATQLAEQRAYFRDVSGWEGADWYAPDGVEPGGSRSRHRREGSRYR